MDVFAEFVFVCFTFFVVILQNGIKITKRKSLSYAIKNLFTFFIASNSFLFLILKMRLYGC